jgi:hypothetical protein
MANCLCYTCASQRTVSLGTFVVNEAVTRMTLCPDCGNKRCPKATYHGHACTGSNESGQSGSRYARQPVEVAK